MNVSKGKWISRVCGALLVLALIVCTVLIGILTDGYTHWKADVPSSEMLQSNDEDEFYGYGTAKVQAVSLSMNAAAVTAANGSVSKTLTAYVYPEDAKNKAVDWTIEWLDTEETREISDYLTLVPDSDGSATAQLTCLQAFDGEALVTVTSREGAFFDTCRVLFVGNPSSVNVSCDALSLKSGSFGTYYEIGAGNSYTFDITPDNVFGTVGAECNYTFEVKGHGSFKTQTQYYYTVNDGKTWEEGTEQTVNIADVTTVSKYEPSVFDWSVSGNKLTVNVNCTLESYYTSSVRNGNMITYENKFREYTDDNWYYEVIVTETNSGVSTSFKVRPVKTVTNVVLADDIVTF
mgnify:FL=1